MAGRVSASKEASSMNQAGRVSRMDTIGTDTPISKAKNARARKGSATPAMKQKKNKTSVVEDPDDDNGNTGNTGNKKQNLTKKRKKGPLDCGDNIELSNVTYQIQKLIRNPGPNAEYYLTEGTAEKILKKVRETNTASEKWFYLDAVDSGQYQKFDYLITSSYNIQLYEVHRALNRVFTRDCVMNIAYQTLESIRALHNAGFINRNIKPASFSIGPTSKDHLVCMSDFRITRKHIDEATQKPRAIRPKIEYIGTARYASISSLKGLEQGRRDDLEAWLYMIL
ncbi:unnamed protein product [Caenorhabditis angaria]|uniref:Protein kinase domain-containing protein n=1 Tax=Caenorhabditis angaria TaxID=860376 RepID=A0A9P1IQ07_9PELO|nr:unnamed protein product [Caenorhabditis angaria]